MLRSVRFWRSRAVFRFSVAGKENALLSSHDARTREQADPITSITVGAINVNSDGAAIAGGVDNCVYGAGWVVGKNSKNRMMGSDYTAASVTIDVNSDVTTGTANRRGIFGGALAAHSGSVRNLRTGPFFITAPLLQKTIRAPI